MKDTHVDPGEGNRPEGPSATDLSLLGRVKAQSPDAWRRLVKLYGPTVYGWCRRVGLGEDDAADVAQEVFRAVAANIDAFRRDRPGDSFRGWLWTITRNKINDHWRRYGQQPQAAGGTEAHERLAQVPAEEAAELSGATGETAHLLRRALDLLRPEFEDRTWTAFWRVTVDGHAPADVASDLGMSANAVYVAKSRVLRRLRDELEGAP